MSILKDTAGELVKTLVDKSAVGTGLKRAPQASLRPLRESASFHSLYSGHSPAVSLKAST